jgi:hypothetical protein
MKTIILYHGNCPDGFGGAYAAWKKFGDSVEYIALHRDTAIPTGLAGNDLIFVDFCYEKPIMDTLIHEAASVVVLDHHEGNEDVVRAMPTNVYDENRSGASIAWNYFHPDTPLPYFLKLVEQVDLYRPISDDDRALMRYAYAQPWTFTGWDDLTRRTEDASERSQMVERGRAYAEYFNLIVEQLAKNATPVSFEGYTCYLVEAPRMFTTDLGKRLADDEHPFTLIAHARADSIRVSMRGNGKVDLTKVAQKYSGNGHPDSAAFSIPWGTPLPWKPLGPINS